MKSLRNKLDNHLNKFNNHINSESSGSNLQIDMNDPTSEIQSLKLKIQILEHKIDSMPTSDISASTTSSSSDRSYMHQVLDNKFKNLNKKTTGN